MTSLATLYWKMDNEAGCHEMLMKMEALGNKQTVANSEMGMINAVMGNYEIAAAYFEKALEKREALLLFSKYTLMALDETLYYVPQIENVLEKVEAFKRK